jgi:NADH:ubiquinone oxidoreductase subunit E
MAEEETQEQRMRAIQAAIGGFCAAQMHHQELQDEAIAAIADQLEQLAAEVNRLKLMLSAVGIEDGWGNQ